jgi:hypothetical protein
MTEILDPFDIETLTLGEGLAVERASGLDIQSLIRTRSGLLLLAVFVQRLRSSGQPPSWSELTALRISNISSGRSRSPVSSQSAKSEG